MGVAGGGGQYGGRYLGRQKPPGQPPRLNRAHDHGSIVDDERRGQIQGFGDPDGSAEATAGRQNHFDSAFPGLADRRNIFRRHSTGTIQDGSIDVSSDPLERHRVSAPVERPKIIPRGTRGGLQGGES